MAKDKRDKRTAQQKQVNLAQKAGKTGAGAPAAARKKKKSSRGKRIVTVLLVILIIVSLAFVIVAGISVYKSLATPGEDKDPVILSSHETTPASEKNKVSYFLVGLMGEEPADATAMLSLVCYDKAAKSIQVLQVPADTYLGDSGKWAVKTAGGVYGNPKPLDWCESCRKQVFEPEIKDGKHTACGTKITQKAGSATENLINVFTNQYSMPVDNFFLLPQEALVKLVNLAGGIDVNLEADMKVESIQYKKGVQTLDGDAALYYAVKFSYKDTPDSDVERLVRQRKVYTSLFQRLCAMDAAKRQGDVFAPLMNGSTPIRLNNSKEALASLLIDPSNKKMEDMTPAMALTEMFTDMGEIPMEKIAFYLMPGESAKSGKDAYYSVHKSDLASLLQENFNPYGAAITDKDILVTELKTGKKTDVKKQTMAELKVNQAGVVTTTAKSTTTKATTAATSK